MDMPIQVRELIGLLLAGGHSAYAVGGCVRDSLLNRAPADWDIATSATPDQMKACLVGVRTIDSGIRHGTITALVGGSSYEITTFRLEGAYSDHRRPDSVQFVPLLRDDLSRRDFTINAMALDWDGALIDPFDGQADLANKLIRCVGDPHQRFEEDALRILRALRFASTYGFEVEPRTAAAMRETRGLLRYVSAERVQLELRRMLLGQGVRRVLMAFPDVLGQVIPEILPAVGFDQRNPHHDSDVWGHTARAVEAAPPDFALRLTMLLHDLGKPECFEMGEDGMGHFYGHARRSERIADRVLDRLRCDNKTRARVLLLVPIHDQRPEPTRRWLTRRLNQLGPDALGDLLRVQRADTMAQSPLKRTEKLGILAECEAVLSQLLEERACFSLRDLAVNGGDLIALGIAPGRRIGETLERLLLQVMDGQLPNERAALLGAASIRNDAIN